jgi:hypothetical protein
MRRNRKTSSSPTPALTAVLKIPANIGGEILNNNFKVVEKGIISPRVLIYNGGISSLSS